MDNNQSESPETPWGLVVLLNVICLGLIVVSCAALQGLPHAQFGYILASAVAGTFVGGLGAVASSSYVRAVFQAYIIILWLLALWGFFAGLGSMR